MKILLGIDPGTRITGFGVIAIEGPRFRLLDFGAIRPKKNLSSAEIYYWIFCGVEQLIEKFSPTAISVESQFMYKNAQTAIKLGMARGAVLIAGAKNGLPIHEFTPRKAKQSVVGNGSASKEQVQKMVQLLLQLESPPEPEDASDALALAICLANTLNFEEKTCTNTSKGR